jgi:cytochrome P450
VLELRAMIGAVLFAGYDITRNQLGHALFTFTHHPKQWALLAKHPELALVVAAQWPVASHTVQSGDVRPEYAMRCSAQANRERPMP